MFSLANTRKKIATHAHHNYHKEKKRKKERMRGGWKKKSTGKRIERTNKESSGR